MIRSFHVDFFRSPYSHHLPGNKGSVMEGAHSKPLPRGLKPHPWTKLRGKAVCHLDKGILTLLGLPSSRQSHCACQPPPSYVPPPFCCTVLSWALKVLSQNSKSRLFSWHILLGEMASVSIGPTMCLALSYSMCVHGHMHIQAFQSSQQAYNPGPIFMPIL